jgi:hypothetical protein
MFSRALSSCGRLLGLKPGSPPTEDRRDSVRFPCALETVCQQPGAAERFPARVENVSRGGINLATSRRFEPGELLSMELPGERGTVLACVVRADVSAAGGWTIGCTFAAELSEEDLERFGALRARETAADPRARVRFPCRARAVFQVVRDPEAKSWPARVVDISASGVGLAVSLALGVGELLSVELRGADELAVLTALASVVRVTGQRAAERVLGCNFIRELTEAELLPLL